MSLLLLGPRYHASGKVGGIVVPFELLVETLRTRGIDHRVIDLNKRNYTSRLWALVKIVVQFIRAIKGTTHVSLHGTRTDFIVLAPLVVAIAKVCGKSVSLRKFAGGFRTDYGESGPVTRWLIRSTLERADVVFFETAFLVDAFKQFNANTHQMRNPRRRVDHSSKSKASRKPLRLVFAGHVTRAKGIVELCNASRSVQQVAQIDIYGDVLESALTEIIEGSPAVYRGRFQPDEAALVLAGYDALILPTLAAGEGYPGVIIEAFSVGLPVIASDVSGIRELVKDGENGFLTVRGDTSDLVDTIVRFSKSDIASLSVGARESFVPFENDRVTDTFLGHIGMPPKAGAS